MLWDSFTHIDGYFVEIFDYLKYSIVIKNFSIPVYKILQHCSTIFGCLIIFIVIIKLPKFNVSNKISIRYWAAIFLTISIVFIIKVILGLHYKLYGELVVTFISSIFIALIIVPIVMKINRIV